MMQDKKITIALVSVFSVSIFLAVYLFIIQPGHKNSTNKTLCLNASDEDIYKKIAEDTKEVGCECIKEEKLKKACIDLVKERSLYKKAVTNSDKSLCDYIENDTSKDSCSLAVENKIAYLKSVEVPKGNPEENISVAYLERTREESPKDIDNLINLAKAYVFSGLNSEKQQASEFEIDKSIAILNEAKELEPKNANVYIAQGYIYSINKQYEEALVAYTKGLELDQDNLEALVGRSGVLYLLKMNKEALSDLERAAKLDSERIYTESIIDINLCRLYAETSDFEKATEKCNSIINGNSDKGLQSEAKKVIDSL